MGKDEFRQFLVQATQHITIFDRATHEPISFGSGCLFKYQNQTWLATVAHVTDIQSGIVTFDSGEYNSNGERIYLPASGNTNALTLKVDQNDPQSAINEAILIASDPARRNTILRTGEHSAGQVDITFFPFSDNQTIKQNALSVRGTQIPETQKIVIHSSLDSLPQSSELFGFFGRIKIKVDSSQRSIQAQIQLQDDLHFVETAEGTIRDDSGKWYRGRYHKFRMNEPIRDHDDFRGTSGAPIIDSNGNLVAFVAFGNLGEPFIYGVPLNILRTLIDVQLT